MPNRRQLERLAFAILQVCLTWDLDHELGDAVIEVVFVVRWVELHSERLVHIAAVVARRDQLLLLRGSLNRV